MIAIENQSSKPRTMLTAFQKRVNISYDALKKCRMSPETIQSMKLKCTLLKYATDIESQYKCTLEKYLKIIATKIYNDSITEND